MLTNSMFFHLYGKNTQLKQKIMNRFCLDENIDTGHLMLLAIYHTRVVTISQLHTTIFRDCKRAYLTMCMNRLIKDNYVTTVKLPQVEGISRKMYAITRKGAHVIEQIAYMKQTGNEKPWNIREHSYFHIFSQSFTVLSTLGLSSECSVAYEQVYRTDIGNSYTSGIKKKNSVCVDTMLYYPRLSKTIYVEQDTGTEDISVLLKKINNYHIVPSFHESQYGDAALFFTFNKHCRISQGTYAATIPLILQAIEGMRRVQNNCTVENFYNYMSFWKTSPSDCPSYITKQLFSRECMDTLLAVTLCIRHYSLDKATKWLGSKENMYILFETLYCIKQQVFARNRMNSMKKLLLSTKYDTASVYFNALSQIYNGMHCYCVASSGANSLISEFLWGERDYIRLAAKIFPERANTGEFRDVYRTEIGNLCNCVCYNDGFVLSFEDIQYDLGGYIRCIRTARTLKHRKIKERICLCMLFDERSVLDNIRDDSGGEMYVNGEFSTDKFFISCFIMFNGGFCHHGILDGEIMYIDDTGKPYKV